MTKQQTIHAVSKDARTMGSWDLFATWIGANANNGTWFIGGIIAATGLIQGSTLLLVVGCLSYVLLALASLHGVSNWCGGDGANAGLIWREGIRLAIDYQCGTIHRLGCGEYVYCSNFSQLHYQGNYRLVGQRCSH